MYSHTKTTSMRHKIVSFRLIKFCEIFLDFSHLSQNTLHLLDTCASFQSWQFFDGIDQQRIKSHLRDLYLSKKIGLWNQKNKKENIFTLFIISIQHGNNAKWKIVFWSNRMFYPKRFHIISQSKQIISPK